MTRSTGSDTYRTELALVGAIVVFGVNYPVLKVVSDQLPPFPLNAIRFTVSVVAMGFLLRGGLMNSLRRCSGNGVRLILLALLGYFLSPLFLLEGLRYSTATNAALILAGAPIWTALLSWYLGNDRVGIRGWLGLVVSTVGLVVVTVPLGSGQLPGEATLYGNLFLFGDSVVWGSYVALQKNLLDRVDPLEASFWSLIVVIPFLFAGSYGSLSISTIAGLSASSWMAIVFSGVFSMGVAHLWWNLSLRDFGPTTVSIYANGIPLVSVLIGWLVLAESLTVRHLLGGTVLLIGVYFARMDRRRRGEKGLGIPES